MLNRTLVMCLIITYIVHKYYLRTYTRFSIKYALKRSLGLLVFCHPNTLRLKYHPYMYYFLKTTISHFCNKLSCHWLKDMQKVGIFVRGSSELVLLASQLTKPLKLKRLFPSLVFFLNPSPEAPSSIDLKRENMNSTLIITNLTCWLLVSWLRLLKWLLLGRL